MVRHPDVFLMDEPLSNLDAKLRVHMRSELADLHKRLQTTFVYVTHDQVEAMTMSDRVAMMDAGSILQLGTPSELYAAPANVKVAQFIGSPTINLLPATVADQGAIEVLGQRLRLRTSLAAGSNATVGIRPEAIAPRGNAPLREGQVALGAHQRRVENLGSEYILHFDVNGLDGTVVTSRVPADHDPGFAGPAELVFDLAACHVFDAHGERVEPLDRPRQARNPRVRLYLDAGSDA
jgi:multiple sugar transport system ATP-binding protein